MITELAVTYIQIPYENKTKPNQTEPLCELSSWTVNYHLSGLGLPLPSTDNARHHLSGERKQEALSGGNYGGEVGIVADTMLSWSFLAITVTVDSRRSAAGAQEPTGTTDFYQAVTRTNQLLKEKNLRNSRHVEYPHNSLKKKKSNFVLWKISNNRTNSIMKPTHSSLVSTIIGWQPILFQHFPHLPLCPQSYFQARLIYHIILPINISVRTSKRWLFKNNTNIFKSLVLYYNFFKETFRRKSFFIVISVLHGNIDTWIAITAIYRSSYCVADHFLGAFHGGSNVILASISRSLAVITARDPIFQLREVQRPGQDATDTSSWLIQAVFPTHASPLPAFILGRCCPIV